MGKLFNFNVANNLALILFFISSITYSAVSFSQPPAHLDILSATIEELPPINFGNAANRQVVLRIELSGIPNCTSSSPIYGFLIDADKSNTTGTIISGLGIDARVSAECEPTTGIFVSPIGSVMVSTDANKSTIEITTLVKSLPSLDFQWIAFAYEEMLFIQLPDEPNYGAWAVHEKALY